MSAQGLPEHLHAVDAPGSVGARLEAVERAATRIDGVLADSDEGCPSGAGLVYTV